VARRCNFRSSGDQAQIAVASAGALSAASGDPGFVADHAEMLALRFSAGLGFQGKKR
jgi:hypothetical protein